MTNKKVSKNNEEKLLTVDKENFQYLKYKLFSNIDLSKKGDINEYYQWLAYHYKINGYSFIRKPYFSEHSSLSYAMINIYALILGPLYFLFNGLYFGLFVNLFGTMLILQTLSVFINEGPLFFIGNVLCGLTANYFLIMKSESRLNCVLNFYKWKNAETSTAKIQSATSFLNRHFKFIHLFLGCVFTAFLFYFFMFVFSPQLLLNPVENFHNINEIMIQTYSAVLRH